MKSTRKLLPHLAWALVVVAALVVRAPAQQPVGNNDPTFRSISNKLLCQCGTCNYMVLSCNHVDCPSATYIRKTIQTDLASGKSEDMILASFVQEYGPKILAEPPRQGFTWLAWLMPYFGLGLGACAVFFVLSKWGPNRKKSRDDAAVANREQQALLEKYRVEIDREIGKD